MTLKSIKPLTANKFGLIIFMLVASALVVNTVLTKYCGDVRNSHQFSHMKAT